MILRIPMTKKLVDTAIGYTYIAMNENGVWDAFLVKPIMNEACGCWEADLTYKSNLSWENRYPVHKSLAITTELLDLLDWKNSIFEVKEIMHAYSSVPKSYSGVRKRRTRVRNYKRQPRHIIGQRVPQ